MKTESIMFPNLFSKRTTLLLKWKTKLRNTLLTEEPQSDLRWNSQVPKINYNLKKSQKV